MEALYRRREEARLIQHARDIIASSKAILLDVEGTITSCNFVKGILYHVFDYNLEDYVITNWDETFMKEMVMNLLCMQHIFKDAEGFVELPSFNMDTAKSVAYQNMVIEHLKWQQSKNRKTCPLQYLREAILRKGYEQGIINGHVYEDVPPCLKAWKNAKKKIYTIFSGTKEARHFLFKHSIYGDLSEYITGHFDASVGEPTEPKTYKNIVDHGFEPEDLSRGLRIKVRPYSAVLISDRPREIIAAKKSGLKTIRIRRNEIMWPFYDEPVIPYWESEAKFLGEEDAFIPSLACLLKDP